jgi:hypothetical protein
MRAGQRVRISGAAGVVIGRVEHLATLAELPHLADVDHLAQQAGYPDSVAAVREILAEADISRVAWITYRATPAQQLLFAALEIRGEWRDLRGNVLTIQVVS